MTTGWPQNQQDLRWSYAEDGEERSGNTTSAQQHPSGPLPVGQPPQRGKSRNRNRDRAEDTVPDGDADYDWIRYLGAAGPAQEHNAASDAPPPRGRRERRQAAAAQQAQPPAEARPASGPRPAANSFPGAGARNAEPATDPRAQSQVPTRPAPHRGQGLRGPAPISGPLPRIGSGTPGKRVLPPMDPPARPEPRSPLDWAPGTDSPSRPAARPGPSREAPTEPPARSAGPSWSTPRPVAQPPARTPSGPPADRPGDARRSDSWRTNGWDDDPLAQSWPSVRQPPLPPRPDDPRRPSRPHIARHGHGQPPMPPAAAAGPRGSFADAPAIADRRPDAPFTEKAGAGTQQIERERVTGKPPKPGKPAKRGPKQRPDKRAKKATAAQPAAKAAAAATAIAPAPARTRTDSRPQTAPSSRQKAAKAKAGKRRAVRRTMWTVTALACAGGGFVGFKMLTATQPAHAITAPPKLGSYSLEPPLASGMGLSSLQAKIVKGSAGEATHVVGAVYEDATGPAAKNGPAIILFVGGNLSGSSTSFIQSLTQALPGAVVTSAGSLGGKAVCVPGAAGQLTKCAWADNDTFGVIASPGLSVAQLSSELRSMRPLVEHVVKKK